MFVFRYWKTHFSCSSCCYTVLSVKCHSRAIAALKNITFSTVHGWGRTWRNWNPRREPTGYVLKDAAATYAKKYAMGSGMARRWPNLVTCYYMTKSGHLPVLNNQLEKWGHEY